MPNPRITLIVLASLLAMTIVVTIRWYVDDKYGCDLNLNSTDFQLGCASLVFTGGPLWCEGDWSFMSLGHPPSGYCKRL